MIVAGARVTAVAPSVVVAVEVAGDWGTSGEEREETLRHCLPAAAVRLHRRSSQMMYWKFH